MSVLFTSRQRVKDWDTYKAAAEKWIQSAKAHGCTMFKVYWRGGDPDEILLITEWPNHKVLDEFGDEIGQEVNSYLVNPETEDIMWTLSDAAQV